MRPAERERPQEFVVDVEVDCDLDQPSRTDSITDTIDYRQIRAIAKEVVEGESMQLLESLAGRIADGVLKIPGALAVSVRVTKRPATMMPIAGASVRIERGRR